MRWAASGNHRLTVTAYQYDALGRLVDYDAATGSDETYAWQATTNRSSRTVGGGGAVTT